MFKWIMRLLSAAVVVLVLWWGLRFRNGDTRTVTASAAPPPALPELSCGDKAITDQGIGKLRIGMSVDSLGKQCPVRTDTIQPGPEGTTERRVTVAFAPDLVDAEIVDGRVWRIDVESPAFRTADSLGVGSSVAEVLRRDDPEGAAGEGAFYLISRTHCGLSYQLSGGIPARVNHRWDKAALSTLPASMEVDKVLVSACSKR
jgi:hypothetical protein